MIAGLLCGRCGHTRRAHHRPRVLWAAFGHWACRHRYTFGSHRQMTSARCACDGWKASS